MKQTTATATLRYLRMSPRKTRLLADMIRGMRAEDAITQLSFSKKAAALPLRKLLRSAVANAVTTAGADASTLEIRRIQVDGGPMQYRYRPRAFGRAAPIRRRTAHVTIELGGSIQEKEKKTS